MVPAAAFATEAEDVQTSDDALELLAVSPNTAWNNGVISAAKDNASKTYDQTAAAGTIEFSWDGKAHYVTPTAVEYEAGGETQTIDITAKKFDIKYYVSNAEGTYTATKTEEVESEEVTTDLSIAPSSIKDEGYYVVVVNGNAATDSTTDVTTEATAKKILFHISKTSFEGAYVYETGTDENDTSDTTITYNGTDWAGEAPAIWVADKSGKVLPAGETATTYQVKFYKKGSAIGETSAEVTDAGDYVAVVFAGNQNTFNATTALAQIEFKVEPLDLSATTFGLKWANGTMSIEKVNGKAIGTEDGSAYKGINTDLDLTFQDGPAATVSTAGTYNYTVAKHTPSNGNYINSGTASYDVVSTTLDEDNIFYGGTKAATGISKNVEDGVWTINHADNNADFDASKVAIYPEVVTEDGTTKGDAKGAKLTTAQYSVTIKNEDGNEVTDCTAAGDYVVTIKVNAAATSYKYGGEYTFTLKVTNGTIDGSTAMLVKYDGAVASSLSKYYTGEDYLSKIAVAIADPNNKALVEGTDYTLVVTDNLTGEEVDEIVDPGNYTITAEGITYKINDGTFKVEVKEIPVGDGDVQPGDATEIAKSITNEYTGVTTWLKSDKVFYAYTGEDIVPAVEYATIDEDGSAVKDSAGNVVFEALDADAYTLSYNKAVYADDEFTDGAAETSIKTEGWHKVTLTDADSMDAYAISPAAEDVASFYIYVGTDRTYKDVPANAWFNDAVTDATMAGYMSGYSGTDLFGPYDKMTRGQVAVVLFRMAGNTTKSETDGSANENITYPTKFEDVDAKAYYAQAIQWASQRGIVTGYSDTKFGPEDSVTREQFAVMMARYEKAANGTLGEINTNILDYDDAAAVDEWAEEAIEWAVDKGIMGVNTTVLNPTGDIIRAEAAAMLVRYAPYTPAEEA